MELKAQSLIAKAETLAKADIINELAKKWPPRNIHSEENKPLPFHAAQEFTHDSPFRTTGMIAGSQGGKGLALDTDIPTPTGFVKMANLYAGLVVHDKDNAYCNVTAVTAPYMPERTYQLEFTDGTSLICDGDHQWLLQNGAVETVDTILGKVLNTRYRIPVMLCDQQYFYTRGITSIKRVPNQYVKCITVDSPTGTYLAGRYQMPTHNTSYGPWWLKDEILSRGTGDYLAVTATFDMFKLKMLPSMLSVFEQILGIGRYWTGDRVIELMNPYTGKFLAKKSTDRMWGRIILRSADALGGLESATAKAGWLDEAGQDKFTLEAYKAIRRRLALNVGRILVTTTLYNIGWLTQLIVDPAIKEGSTRFIVEGDSEIDLTDSPKTNTRIIQFDSILNPLFPKEEFEEARQLLPDEEFQMFYRGRKGSRRFLIYDSFDYTKHTMNPFPIPQSWERYIGLDFGGAHTCAMFYAEEPGTGKLYCYREYLAGGRTIEEHVKFILKDEAGIPMCVGGAQSEDQWRRDFGNMGLPVLVPTVKEVDIGINRVYAQHKSDGIVYFNTLSGIIDQKGRYRRKRDKEGTPTGEIEMKNTFHYLDAERYIISTIRPGTSLKAKIINLGGATWL